MGCVGSKVPAGTELEPANPPSGSNSKSARGRTKVPFSPSRNGVSTRQRSSNDNSKHDNRSPKAAISPARRRKAEKERLLEERRRKNEVMNLKIALGLWLDVHMPAAAVRLRMFMFGQGLRNEAKENADEVTGDDSVAPVNYGGPLNGTDSAEVVAKPKPRQPTANGFVRISVEAAGSGIPLIASMLLPFDSTVPELKRAISERLSDRPSFSLLLFAGHGGPVLDSHPFRFEVARVVLSVAKCLIRCSDTCSMPATLVDRTQANARRGNCRWHRRGGWQYCGFASRSGTAAEMYRKV